MPAHLLDDNQPPHCQNKGCTEDAKIRLLMSITHNGVTQLRPVFFCQGHAFLTMGKQMDGKWVSCPCCQVWFLAKDATI